MNLAYSVAVASAGGVATVVVGAPRQVRSAGMALSGRGVHLHRQRRGVHAASTPDCQRWRVRQNGFGISVAVAMDGATTTIVVGMAAAVLGYSGGTGNNANKVYVYTGSNGGSIYTEQAILRPSTVGAQLLSASASPPSATARR